VNIIDIAIFAVGLLVTAATLAGAFVIGLTEAADSDHSRAADLTDLERRMVVRDDERA
jgi:hypothetical protein